MKKILLLSSISLSLFASELLVKDADVTLSINAEQKVLKAKERLSIEKGSSICFLNGEGRVIINDSIQLNKDSKSCYSEPVPEGFNFSKFVGSLVSMADKALISGEIKVKSGVATKSTQTAETLIGEYELDASKKEILIHSEIWGPLPVTLNILDNNGNIIREYVNEENEVTFFRVPTSLLNNDSKIVVLNAFEEEIVNKTIKIKKD